MLLKNLMSQWKLGGIVMAQSLQSFVITALSLGLYFTNVFSSEAGHPGIKSLHFTLYQHETANKTAYMITKGVETGEAMNPISPPFGSRFQFQDPLTTKADQSSKVVGLSEGTSFISSLHGIEVISVVKMSLSLKNYQGSISILGVTPSIFPGDLSVVGGTGDFLFVEGYITSSAISSDGTYLVYKIELHLYWPPYFNTRPTQSIFTNYSCVF